MPALEVMNADVPLRPGYFAPSCAASGPIRSALFHPDGYSLWELEAELGEGAELMWGDRHGDEVLYVIDGELDIQGSHCGPKAAAIVESGVAVTVRATTGTKLIHFGPVSIDAPENGLHGAPLKTGHGVHVVSIENARRLGRDDVAGATYYCDSNCLTCRAYLMEAFFRTPRVIQSHYHSEDEIIRVTEGELRVGRSRVASGQSIAIPAGHRYGFRTPGPASFLNYRRDASLYVGAPGTAPVPEQGAAPGN